MNARRRLRVAASGRWSSRRGHPLGPGAELAPPLAAAGTLPATFSADALSTWQTNGPVWALESVGGVVYAGGEFTKVRPPGAAVGDSREVTRNNLAAFDAATGEVLPCHPSITSSSGRARVFALEASPAGDRLYVGGSFGRVGGVGVAGLVALNPSTCALLPSSSFRRPDVSAAVRALSASSTALYVGGDFTRMDGRTRTRFAGLTANGTLMSGTVTLDAPVRAVQAAPDFGKVLVGGDFATVNGTTNKGLVAVDPTSLAVVQFFPGWIPANSVPKAITRDATSFYVGDEGSGYGVFDGRIAGDLATGELVWKDYCLGATQALVVDRGVLYAGHHAHECSTTPGGWLEDGIRNHLTGQDVVTKELIPTFFPDTNDGVGSAPQGPRALTVSGDHLWVGGEFSTVNAVAQRGLTRFGRADLRAASPPVPTVLATRAGANVVSWIAAYDRDEDALTYELYRDTTLVHTVTARSREWTRGQLSYLDTGVEPGQVVQYRLRVLEPDGENTSLKGPAVTVTTAATDTGYPAAVLADSPALYWRLDETAEQQAATRNGAAYYRARMLDSSGNARQATADRGYTTVSPDGYALGAPSALADGSGNSVRFSGTTGRIAESFTNAFEPATTGPSEYTVELWFRTAGTSGGRLAGFGDRRTELYEREPPGSSPPVYRNSLSTRTDRLLYLTDTGRLTFGTLSGSTRVTIASTSAYNDRQWHHVVATSGPDGMRLYVDGVRVASGASTANASYPGYWKLGYDTLSGWPNRPAKSAVAGDVDEFAVYHRALSGAEAADHFLAGRRPTSTWSRRPRLPG